MGTSPNNQTCLLQNKILKDLEHVAVNTAAKEGFEIVGLNFLDKMKPMTIQILIRLQGGGDVSLDDCYRLSKPMGDSIESSQVLDIPYVLEVSSPGLKDILETDKEFETFKGFPIEVSTRDNPNCSTIETGLLHTRSQEHLLINVKGKISKIPREQVIQVRLTNTT